MASQTDTPWPPMFLASGLVPASLPVMSPMAISVRSEPGPIFAPPSLPPDPVQHAGEERGFSPNLPAECTAPMLRLCPHVYSRWFLAMRSAIRRERVRQQLFREEHNLPKSARIPYERPVLTATEANDASFCETLVRSLFGDIPADYARDKFRHAINTGDMRAFKIRLLLIKVRDTLASTSSPLYPHFLSGIEQCISEAETLAGCIPDPSPRRLSHAEQEKRKSRQPQPQPQPQTQTQTQYHTSTDATEVKDNINKGYCSALNASSPGEHPKIQDIEKPENGISSKRSKTKGITGKPDNSGNGESVTVTQNHSVTVTLHPQNGAVVRKARDYHSVDEIMEDIEAGKITPYASSEEICTDIVAGKLTPEEALMFTAALERYNPEDAPDSDDPTIQELEKECVDMEEAEDPEMDEVEDCDDDGYVIDRRQPSISYNPRGFGACRGRYSDSGTDWEKDDEW